MKTSAHISAETAPPKKIRHGDYEVPGEIARGGMASLTRPQVSRTDRRVKMISPARWHREGSSDFVPKLRRRADSPPAHVPFTIGRPRVRTTYDEVGSRGRPRANFPALMKDPGARRPSSPGSPALFTLPIAAASCTDLKPAIILMDARGEPHVPTSPAKRVGHQRPTGSGTIVGTPSYMALNRPSPARTSARSPTSTARYSINC